MNWLRRIMIGRYGSDQLNFALVALSLVLILVGNWTDWGIFSMLAFALLLLTYLRMFSRNTYKRYEENQKFLKLWNPIKARFSGKMRTVQDAKTHKHFKCAQCGQKLRVPKGRGKVSIICPKCGNEFVKNT